MTDRGEMEGWRDGGMEWRRNGVADEWGGRGMKRWSGGVMEHWRIGLGVIWIFARINRIRFIDDECFGPCTGIPLAFERFD
jgi:hypothetical protein